MLIPVYTRDENGFITYHGQQEWDAEIDFWEYYFRVGHEVEREYGLMGWPHVVVDWRGNTGIGRA